MSTPAPILLQKRVEKERPAISTRPTSCTPQCFGCSEPEWGLSQRAHAFDRIQDWGKPDRGGCFLYD